MTSLIIIAAAAAVALFLALQQWGLGKARGNLPPGPKPLPIVGNILDLPPKGVPQWKHWLKQQQLYGPISSITVLGQTIISLNDRKAATEMMEKRGLKNSSRPSLHFSFNMVGFGNYTIGQPYGKSLNLHRKLMIHFLGTKAAVEGTQKIQEEEVAKTLVRMLEKPQDLFEHFRIQAGAVIIRLTYGYTADTTREDPVLFLVSRMMERFTDSTSPGTWLVDSISSLKYIPSWFPGGEFKKLARTWYNQSMEAADIPYEFVKRRLEHSIPQEPSYVCDALSNAKQDIDPSYEHAVKFSAATLFGGGADSTLSSLMFLYLAMLKYPNVLRKAQEDIDRVTGGNRLPQFSDREELPYIENIVKEAYRWQPVAPNGVAHTCSEDQMYEGYLIPKGSVLIPNVRWFCNDPESYHDPEAFIPERYSEPYNEPDPKEFIFGYGRRICPGRVFADASLYLTISQTFAVFNIEKALDGNGNEIEPELAIPPGQISHPEDYPFRLVPRSEKHAQLIRNNARLLNLASQQTGDAELLGKLGLMPDRRNASDDMKFSYV